MWVVSSGWPSFSFFTFVTKELQMSFIGSVVCPVEQVPILFFFVDSSIFRRWESVLSALLASPLSLPIFSYFALTSRVSQGSRVSQARSYKQDLTSRVSQAGSHKQDLKQARSHKQGLISRVSQARSQKQKVQSRFPYCLISSFPLFVFPLLSSMAPDPAVSRGRGLTSWHPTLDFLTEAFF